METSTHVNLKQYRKVDGKWQFVSVLRRPGGGFDTNLVIVNGEAAPSKGGTFYLEYKDLDGRRRQRPVGKIARDALNALRQQVGILRGEIEPAPEDLTPEPVAKPGRTTIDQAIKEFLDKVKATKRPATFRAYRQCLDWGRSKTSKRFVDEVGRDDVIALFAAGREDRQPNGKPYNQKTVNKRVMIMLQAMRYGGAIIQLEKGTWPKTVERKIEAYLLDDVERFLETCNDEERLLFQVFLHTGFRDQEVGMLTWDDVDWDRRHPKLGVNAKPEWGFNPKNYEVRQVPIFSEILAKLRERKQSSTSPLVFPTPEHPRRPDYGGAKANKHFLEMCKEIALRAGLNCKTCKGTYTVFQGVFSDKEKGNRRRKEKVPYDCARDPRCHKWNLHKWRHTYATETVKTVDIRTLQMLMGHKNIATAEKYLDALRIERMHAEMQTSSLRRFVT